MSAADMPLSRNALIALALETHLTCTPHLMGEMSVRDIWDPHARVLRESQRAQSTCSSVRALACHEGRGLHGPVAAH